MPPRPHITAPTPRRPLVPQGSLATLRTRLRQATARHPTTTRLPGTLRTLRVMPCPGARPEACTALLKLPPLTPPPQRPQQLHLRLRRRQIRSPVWLLGRGVQLADLSLAALHQAMQRRIRLLLLQIHTRLHQHLRQRLLL